MINLSADCGLIDPGPLKINYGVALVLISATPPQGRDAWQGKSCCAPPATAPAPSRTGRAFRTYRRKPLIILVIIDA